MERIVLLNLEFNTNFDCKEETSFVWTYDKCKHKWVLKNPQTHNICIYNLINEIMISTDYIFDIKEEKELVKVANLFAANLENFLRPQALNSPKWELKLHETCKECKTMKVKLLGRNK